MKVGHFGIAIQTYNNRFNVMKKWETTYHSDGSNSVVVQVPTGGSSDGTYMVGKVNSATPNDNDSASYGGNICRIIVGPSTHIDNVGAIEEHQIVEGSSASLPPIVPVFVIPQADLTYNYTAGDPVTIIGPGLPNGWTTSPVSPEDFSFGSILTEDGFNSPYGFEVRNITGAILNFATFQLPKSFPMGAWVRMSIKYKMKNFATSGGFGSMLLRLVASSTLTVLTDSIGADIEIAMTDNTDTYVEDSIVFKVPDIDSVIDQPYSLFLYLPQFQSADYLKIASISLTHSSYASNLPASGDHTDFNAGYSLIDEYPVLGSVKVKRIDDNQKLSKNIDGRFYASNVMDRMIMPVTRYQISYELDSPSSTSATTIDQLIDFQNRGYLLNHFPQMDGVPHCLTGRLEVKRNKKYHITDLTKQRFTLVFTEVAV